MMDEVRADALDKSKAKMRSIRATLPDWTVGDAVELEYAFERGDKDPAVIRGSIVGRRRKGLDSSFVIKNEFGDDILTARIPVMTPLLRSMRIMRKHHVRGGRRVRRAQLTYLASRPVSEYRVTVDTKEEWEHALEAKIRRELQRSGRNWGKKAVAEEKAKIFKTGRGVVRVDASMDFTQDDVQQASATAAKTRRGREKKAAAKR
jgi:ribosomal protein L19